MAMVPADGRDGPYLPPPPPFVSSIEWPGRRSAKVPYTLTSRGRGAFPPSHLPAPAAILPTEGRGPQPSAVAESATPLRPAPPPASRLRGGRHSACRRPVPPTPPHMPSSQTLRHIPLLREPLPPPWGRLTAALATPATQSGFHRYRNRYQVTARPRLAAATLPRDHHSGIRCEPRLRPQ